MEPCEGNPIAREGRPGRITVRGKLFLLASAGIAVGGLVLKAGSPPPPLHAAPPPPNSPDSDGDGMPDSLELQLNLDPNSVDSDGDGVPDLDEFLLKTDPGNAASTPTIASAQYSVRVFGYRADNQVDPEIRLGVGIYLPDGNLAPLAGLQFVVMLSGVPFNLLPLAANDSQGIVITPGILPGSLNLQFSFSAPLSCLLSIAPFSLGAGTPGTGLMGLDAAYFDTVGGVLGVYNFTTTSNGASAAFRPLDPGGLPPSWGAFGQGCVLTMESGGSSGPFVLVEVTAAGCEPYPGYCEAAACAQKNGSVHLILDVLGAIGHN
jgi:hypothetical protein